MRKQYGLLAIWMNFFGVVALMMPLLIVTPVASGGINSSSIPQITAAGRDVPVSTAGESIAEASPRTIDTAVQETIQLTGGMETEQAAITMDGVAKAADVAAGPAVTARASSGKTRLNFTDKAKSIKTIPAPNFKLTTLDGTSVSLSELKGKNVMINFWASWCGPCTSEMPHIQSIYDKISDEDLMVLTINYRESEDIVREYVKDSNMAVPVLLDTNGELARQYNVYSIPRTYFVNPEGNIYAVKFGSFETSDEILSYLE